MKDSTRFLSITLPYLAFTVTDGALRILVVLAFHALHFSPLAIAGLFLLYEVAGIFTNFLGGWIASRIGLNRTLIAGMALQVLSLALLTVKTAWLTVPYVMLTQGLSGMAKDLVKMSSKSGVKVLTPKAGGASRLFKWVSVLTGSKNALKGVGFLLGGVMMASLGFKFSMGAMAGLLAFAAAMSGIFLPKDLGKAKAKVKFKSLFSRTREINVLSAARFFLFGSRDVWFVIALPVFLEAGLGWKYETVGGFLALWVVGYGMTQALVPKFFNGENLTSSMGPKAVSLWAATLALFPAGIAFAFKMNLAPEKVLVAGLLSYGIFFAVNSIIHSYLVLEFSDEGNVATDVGFYYMANAGGRLIGTLLSGWVFQAYGFTACLWWSTGLLVVAALISLGLPNVHSRKNLGAILPSD